MCRSGDVVPMWLPSWPNYPHGKWVGVDRCIAQKVKDLRSKGIRTLASCCGHGEDKVGEVAIDDRDVSRARMLGYRVEWKGLPHYDEFFVVMFNYQGLQVHHARVAQMVEQRSCKPPAVSSILTPGLGEVGCVQ